VTATAGIRRLITSASSVTARLEGIWKSLWRFLTFSLADDAIYPGKNLCVSIEKGGITMAFGTRFLSRYRIKGFKTYPLDKDRYPQPEGVASSAVLSISHLRAVKSDITLSIPKAWAVIRTAEFPVSIKENIPDVVSYEMDRLTPFSADEALYDFKVLKEKDGKLTLLIVAAKADQIMPYINALREKGFDVGRLTINLSGTGALCRYVYSQADSVFVEINEQGYEGAVFSGDSITGAFAGSLSALDDKSRVDAIVRELEPIIEGIKKDGGSPRVVVLFKDKNPALKEMLKLRISLPFGLLNETDIKVTPGPQREGTPYAAIGGVLESLRPGAERLDLLKKGRHKRPETPIALTVILLLSIAAMGILYMVTPLKIEQKRLSEIDKQIMTRKEAVRKVENIKKEIGTISSEISTIRNFKENKPMALNILKELSSVLPKTAWLTRVRVTETTVEIEGYASSATELIPKLEASRYFRKAEFASPTFRDPRMNADRFMIRMEIEGIKSEQQNSRAVEQKSEQQTSRPSKK